MAPFSTNYHLLLQTILKQGRGSIYRGHGVQMADKILEAPVNIQEIWLGPEKVPARIPLQVEPVGCRGGLIA